MKINNILVSILLSTTILACGKKDRQKEVDLQIKTLTESNEMLRREIDSRDSIMNDAIFTISDISATLSAIRAREGAVISSAETGRIEKNKIKEDLEFLADALESKKSAISSLNNTLAKLKAENVKIDGLTLLVEQLQNDLNKSDTTIKSLLQNIDNLNMQIEIINRDKEVLAEDNAELESLLVANQKQMNRAYYIVGSENELVEMGILLKKGLVGRTVVVNPNMDKSRLIEIDITKLDKIDIKASKVEIVGEFSTNSYTLVTGERKKDVESLIIDNKEQFWKNSKTLVITYKQ